MTTRTCDNSDLEVVKLIGKYLNVPVGPLCYKTDKTLTTVLDNKNVKGFLTIIILMTTKSGVQMSNFECIRIYQCLEYIGRYSKQAAVDPTFARSFLQFFNELFQKDTYVTSLPYLTIADVAAYYTLYPFLERLSTTEQRSLLPLCRWAKHIQAQPKVCENKAPLPLDSILLALH